MKTLKAAIASAAMLSILFVIVSGQTPSAKQKSTQIGETPAITNHVDQADIDSGKLKLKALIQDGESIFAARWNRLDGQGRPAATGASTPTKRDPTDNPGFIRTSGPDSTSCADCHNQPNVGGAGGFVANVFVLSQNLDPATTSIGSETSDERNTLGMNGSGAIEMLAREMTADLLGIKAAAIAQAKAVGGDVTRSLDTKGVNFGQITAHSDGTVDNSEIQGVDADLIIKPFSQKGVVNSVRVFSVNAFNQHHGMEAVERFGVGQIDSKGNAITTHDFDEDGVPDELTVGDITAATVFQTALNIPGRVIADEKVRRQAATAGEQLFADIGCTDCHKPSLTLNSSIYSEPDPYNPPGNLRLQDVPHPFSFDLTKDIPKPRLEATAGGGAVVHAYTDLKRHVICDSQDSFYCNEQLVQNGVPTDEFITRKLWDVGNTAPYGHRGNLTTITDAIMHHSGEARSQRDQFAALSSDQQAQIIEFLKQLQVVPPGSPRVMTESQLATRSGAQSSDKEEQ